MIDPGASRETILVVTSKRDGHIHRVAGHLEAAGHRWMRLNTEDFPRNCSLSIDPAASSGELHLADSGRRIRIEDIRAVWYRKPDPYDLSHFELDQASLDYVEAEFNEMVQGVYALARRALWINNPLTSRPAHRKLLQLCVAREVGFKVPRSIVTNRPDEAINFAESVGFDVAIKSLGALSVTSAISAHANAAAVQYGIFTRRVSREELLATRENIAYMPTLLQEYVDKAHELRVTCVGNEVFTCRIFSQADPMSREDMRFNTRALRHELYEDRHVESLARAYLRAFGLNFGCFDIAVTNDGEVVFFECNPNGQWLWIEELTGAPISRAIADLLGAGAV